MKPIRKMCRSPIFHHKTAIIDIFFTNSIHDSIYQPEELLKSKKVTASDKSEF